MATGITSTTTAPRRMQRDLARVLRDPQSGGVTAYVQECVHSTSVGVDATFIFVHQVIEELDDAIDEYLPIPSKDQPLSYDHEVELGTLLSAASLTVRYVTEKQAMTPLLPRYCTAFDKVLQYPVWTHKGFYGLKTVALMGSTRVLESFSDQVPANDVLKRLRWLVSLFGDESVGTEQVAQRLNALLQPLCELVAVALQTHVATREFIGTEVLLQFLKLLTKVGTHELAGVVAEAVKVELAGTIAVLLEAKSAYTPVNAFALLSLPPFVEEMEAEERLSLDTALVASTSKFSSVDETEEKFTATAAVKQLEQECCEVLCAWLTVETRRLVAAQALAVMYRALAKGTNSVLSRTTPLDVITTALHDAPLTALGEFAFVNALLESIRDICLFQQPLAPSTLDDAFTAMSPIMARLEEALALFPAKERRSAKAACSAIRHTLVAAFLAWLHHPDAAALLCRHVEFLHTVAGSLADPRVYGDVVALLRASVLPTAPPEYALGRQLAVATLCDAIHQLDRYSQSSINRIVAGLTRLAAACREDIQPRASDLVTPLLPSMLDGSQWGTFLRFRTEAVATVLLGCTQSDDFTVENHPWSSAFLTFLLDPVVSSEHVHSFMVLNELIRAHPKLLEHVASYCRAHPHTVTQTLHEPLARWPLYEEDVDLVVTTLDLLEALLRVTTLRATVDVDSLYATVLQLSDHATREKLDAIGTRCKPLMALLGMQHEC